MADTTTIPEPVEQEDEVSSQSSNWLIPGPLPGLDSVSIDKIFINVIKKGEEIIPHPYIRLKTGDSLILVGEKLGSFSKAIFYGTPVYKKPGTEDSILIFKVPDLSDYVKDGGTLTLKLVDSLSEASWKIAPKLLYSFKEEEDENSEEAKKKQREAEQAQELKKGPQVIGEFLNESVAGVAGAVAAGSNAAAKPGPKEATGAKQKAAVDKKSQQAGAAVADEEMLDQDEFSIEEPLKQVLPENLKQSLELVGEYIDKNPEIIANNAVRAEVLTALKTGKLETLSPEGHEVLQRALSPQVVSRTGSLNAQLQTAIEAVNTASVQARAKSTTEVKSTIQGEGGASGTIEARSSGVAKDSTGTEASGQATNQVQSTTEVKKDVSASIKEQSSGSASASTRTEGTIESKVESRVEGKVEGKVTGKVTSEVQASGSTTTQAQASASIEGESEIRQNMEIVGEHLDKNSGIVENTRIKTSGEILRALGSGNIKGLSAQATEDLESTLKILSQDSSGQPANVKKAAQQLSQQLQLSPNPEPGVMGGQVKTTVEENVQEEKEEETEASESSTQVREQDLKTQSVKDQDDKQAFEEKPLSQTQPPEPSKEKESADKAGLKPPAGMKDLKKNELNLGQKLDNTINKPGLVGDSISARSPSKAHEPALTRSRGDELSAERVSESRRSKVVETEALAGQPAQSSPENQIQPPVQPGSPETEAEKGEEEDGEIEPQDEQQPLPPQVRAQTQLPAAASKATDKAAALANQFINAFLLDGVWLVWVFALPSLGAAILIGAIAGDLLWALKKPLLNFAVKRIKLPLLEGDLMQNELKNIADKIKFSLAVKINIVIMNLIVLAAMLLLFFSFFVIMAAGCNWPPLVNKASYKLTVVGYFIGDDCKYFDVAGGVN